MRIGYRVVAVSILLLVSLLSKSQDSLFRMDGKITPCRITKVTNKVIDFLPWDNQDGPEHEINRVKVAYIVYQDHSVQSISDTSVKSTQVKTSVSQIPPGAPANPPASKKSSNEVKPPKASDNAGGNASPKSKETSKQPEVHTSSQANSNIDPISKFEPDATVKLCGFKSNKDEHYKGQKQNYFYVNDPDKKFLHCKQLTCLGMDFSYMRDVSEEDADNGPDIKLNQLSRLCDFMNEDPGLYFLSDKFGPGKKVKPQMQKMKGSWRNVDEKNWVVSDDYHMDPRKIPAIIRSEAFDDTVGLGAVFLVEKFAKAQKTLSGYWVIFDFSGKKVLLIDRLVYTDVTPPIGNAPWWVYWRTGLTDAQVWHPFDIEKYCNLEKKDQFEKVCDN